jgi:OmpA-OmpF porin, OOP family
MSARRTSLAALALVVGLGTMGCGHGSVLHGRIAGYKKLVKQAKDNGAIRCAPRELAMAESHLLFAEIEIEQGFLSRAKDHLDMGATNAKAAYDLSPPAYCTERGFVMPTAEPKPNDRDGDGYPDNEDKCPDQPENFQGYQDEDGCPDDPDTDGDGIPDSKDLCIIDPEDKDGYQDEDGCPEPDNDQDGIADAKDKCPNEPEDPDGFEDEDGCPEPDNDQDKVVDIEDMCPNEFGEATGPKKGCPKKSIVVVTNTEIKITQQIHFQFGKAIIRPDSYKILEAVADVLKRFPKMTLEVQGHTDDRGSAQLNKWLSQQRADAVKKHLITKHSVDSSRLTAKGYGKDEPLVPNNSNINRALNRRVQFIRTDKPKKTELTTPGKTP